MITGTIIIAVILVVGLMLSSWLAGYEEGKEQAFRQIMVLVEEMNEADGEEKRRLTHADLVQLEEEKKNKEQQ